MNEDTSRHDDVLIDVSESAMRQLANEFDDSSLTRTVRRIIDSREGDDGEIAGWSNCL